MDVMYGRCAFPHPANASKTAITATMRYLVKEHLTLEFAQPPSMDETHVPWRSTTLTRAES